jgi:hypothetical protein
MTTFTIDEQNQIVAFATPEQAAAATAPPFDTFTSQKELAELAAQWPAERLLALWNSLPGGSPRKKFKNANNVIGRIWERIQSLGEPPLPQTPRKAHRGTRAAHGAPAEARVGRKAAAAKTTRKRKPRAVAQPSTALRPGTKAAQVVALLQRKNGATLAEIMEKMSWLKHTVRGFMAGAMKKAGYAVESFKPEGGSRTYRLPPQ